MQNHKDFFPHANRADHLFKWLVSGWTAGFEILVIFGPWLLTRGSSPETRVQPGPPQFKNDPLKHGRIQNPLPGAIRPRKTGLPLGGGG